MEYQIGGSLKIDAPSYVERKADAELYDALKRGEFCYVLNSRQMGKSSLLVRTKHRLQQEGFKCTAVDMTNIGSENITPLQWYKGIASDLWAGLKLLGKLNLKTWWKEEDELSLVQRLSRFMSELLVQFSTEKLVIFIDEIDSILSLDFPVDDFFALIRYCYNQRALDPDYNRLTFAIFGVATPSELISDKNRTPFNIGRAIELEGFTLEEIAPLAKGLESKIEKADIILKKILDWTSGQPFLTQKLCHLVYAVSQETIFGPLKIPSGTEEFWVEIIARSRLVQKWESQDEPEHLRTIRDRLLRDTQRAGRLLGIYQQILQGTEVPCDDSREHIELLLSGLVIKKEGFLKVKNKIYEEVFTLEWVEKKLNFLRPYSQALEAWIASKQTDESRLLRGQALMDAQTWAQGKSLSDLDYHFLAASQELDRREIQIALEAERSKAVAAQLTQQQKAARVQQLILGVVSCAFLVSSAMGILAFWQYRQAKISEIRALASSSEGRFASNHQLDAMVEAIKAKRRLQNLRDIGAETSDRVDAALRQAVYGSNEYNRLIGHEGGVLSVDISPNRQLIATASSDKTVKIWKRDGTLLKTLQHQATVHRVAFSPDSRLIVSGTLDGRVNLWSVDGQSANSWQGHQAPVWGVAFSPDGKLIASASGDDTVKLWSVRDTSDRKPVPLKILKTSQQAPWNVAFSPDSQTVATAGVDYTVKLWSVGGRLLKTLKGHRGSVWDVAFCPRINLLVSVSTDRTAKLWKADGSLVRTLQGDEVLLGVDCSENGEYIATSGKDNAVKLWRADGTFVRNLKEHGAVVRDVALSSDGLMAASASDDGTVKLWQRNKYLLKPLYAHRDTIWNITVSPDGKSIVSMSDDNTLGLWRSDGKLLRQLPWGLVDMAFSPDSRIAVGGGSGFLGLFAVGDANQPQVKFLKRLSGHQATIFTVAVSPDGKTIASAGDDMTVKFWDFQGKLLHSIVAHKERIWKIAFSPDGQTLASASEDGTVKLWTVDGRAIATLKNNRQGAVWGVAFSPLGNLIASASRDDTLNLWNLDGTLVKTIHGQSQGLTRVAFSPDGETIATGGADKTVKLWSLQGKLLTTLPGHQGIVVSLAFTPDGSHLISGADDSTVILWDLKQIRALDELEYACSWARDYLRTNQEVEEGDRHLCDGIGTSQ